MDTALAAMLAIQKVGRTCVLSYGLIKKNERKGREAAKYMGGWRLSSLWNMARCTQASVVFRKNPYSNGMRWECISHLVDQTH